MAKKKKKSALGKRLEKWRKGRGLSQDRAAQLLGISFYVYQSWEQGRRAPSGENVTRIKAFLAEVGA